MLIKYDRDARALYIKLADLKVIETIPIDKNTFIDIGNDKSIVGIEIILPKDISDESIEKAIKKVIA